MADVADRTCSTQASVQSRAIEWLAKQDEPTIKQVLGLRKGDDSELARKIVREMGKTAGERGR
jgi:hypothetical protein